MFIIINSCNNNKSYFKNAILEKQVNEFIRDAKYYKKTHHAIKDTVLLQFKKKNNFFEVDFHYKKPEVYKNLFAIINSDSQVIYVYSDYGINEFIYCNEPFKIDTSNFEHYYIPLLSFVDWYSAFLYFNGKKFSRDSLDF